LEGEKEGEPHMELGDHCEKTRERKERRFASKGGRDGIVPPKGVFCTQEPLPLSNKKNKNSAGFGPFLQEKERRAGVWRREKKLSEPFADFAEKRKDQPRNSAAKGDRLRRIEKENDLEEKGRDVETARHNP